MVELTDLSALALAAVIRERRASVREVVESHLRRIDAANPLTHAVVRCSESVLEDADRADALLERGRAHGALHGVPFTVKDWIETEGLVCDGGYPARRNHVPRADASAVARLRAAGAILLGKTRAGSDPALHPAPRNPLAPARTAGSSSGAEAAVVAAGGSPLGLGSDSGGSLRWPAHCCGVSTFKPSAGLVPLTGHFPPIITLTDPRTVIGPLARTVADLIATMAILAGPDGADPSVVPVTVGDPSAVAVPALRVAWLDAFPGAQASSAMGAAVAAAVEALAVVGAPVRPAVPPRIEETMAITRAYWARPESVSLETWRPWGASSLSADEVEASLFQWDRWRRAMLAFMGEFDVLVCPVAADVAPQRDQATADDFAFTVPFSLSGNPVAVIRAGTGDEGLPLGIQIVAAPYRDDVALAVAGTLERHLGPFDRAAGSRP